MSASPVEKISIAPYVDLWRKVKEEERAALARRQIKTIEILYNEIRDALLSRLESEIKKGALAGKLPGIFQITLKNAQCC